MTAVRFPAVIFFLFATASIPALDPNLSNGYRGVLPRDIKLTTHFRLVWRLRMGRAIPQLPHFLHGVVSN